MATIPRLSHRLATSRPRDTCRRAARSKTLRSEACPSLNDREAEIGKGQATSAWLSSKI